jgi:enoyl-CoA hydratase
VSTPHTLFEVDGPLAFFTINRPDARNAMTWEMYEALVRACDEVDGRGEIQVFVIRAAGGRAFIAGTDISQFVGFDNAETALDYERRLDGVIDRVERVRVPTIAQVQGVAAGGGCAIAFACDMRVCTEDARFGIPIARTLGNCLSAANCARLIDLLGPARTTELIFTGRLIDSAEAGSLGLVTRLATNDDVDGVVRRLAADIAAHAPLTIRATKEAVRRIQEHRRIDRSLDDDLITLCYTSADFKEGVAAFLARRPPQFRGR